MLGKNLINLIKRIADKYDTRIYLVGGPLRDKLLGKKIQDLDIVVEKNVKKIGIDLAACFEANFQFYHDFNTGTISLNNLHIDLAQTRKEAYPRPAALPKVFPSNLVSDLYRRDFTINAMAQDLAENRLIDPYQGLTDLKKGIIRILHPRSFIDDPTRIFRAIRFAERFGFKLEPNTLKWLRAAIKQKLPSLLSGERILNELRLIIKEDKNKPMIERLNHEGLFHSLFEKKLAKAFFIQFAKLAKLNEPNLMLVFLLAQFSLPENFPLTKEQLCAINDWKRFSKVKRKLTRAKQPSDVYKLLRGYSDDALRIAERLVNPSIAGKIKKYLEKYKNVRLELGGKDIKKLGIRPGKIYSRLLNNLLFARIDGKVKSRADELKLLKIMTNRLKSE